MMTHTPGPWEFEAWDAYTSTNPSYHPDRIIRANGQMVARIQTRVSVDEHQANARLIAAAPDLLGVLKRFPGFTDNAVVGDAWVELLRAAIRLAETGER